MSGDSGSREEVSLGSLDDWVRAEGECVEIVIDGRGSGNLEDGTLLKILALLMRAAMARELDIRPDRLPGFN